MRAAPRGFAGPAPAVSLNGARSAADGAAVPMSPQDLAEAALAAAAAGPGRYW